MVLNRAITGAMATQVERVNRGRNEERRYNLCA